MNRLEEIRARNGRSVRLGPLPKGASNVAVVNRSLQGDLAYLLGRYDHAAGRIEALLKNIDKAMGSSSKNGSDQILAAARAIDARAALSEIE